MKELSNTYDNTIFVYRFLWEDHRNNYTTFPRKNVETSPIVILWFMVGVTLRRNTVFTYMVYLMAFAPIELKTIYAIAILAKPYREDHYDLDGIARLVGDALSQDNFLYYYLGLVAGNEVIDSQQDTLAPVVFSQNSAQLIERPIMALGKKHGSWSCLIPMQSHKA